MLLCRSKRGDEEKDEDEQGGADVAEDGAGEGHANSRERSGGIFAATADGSVRMLCDESENGWSKTSAISMRTTRALPTSSERKSLRITMPKSSDIAPDTSTPWRGTSVLAAIGLILGSVLWLAASATGLI